MSCVVLASKHKSQWRTRSSSAITRYEVGFGPHQALWPQALPSWRSKRICIAPTLTWLPAYNIIDASCTEPLVLSRLLRDLDNIASCWNKTAEIPVAKDYHQRVYMALSNLPYRKEIYIYVHVWSGKNTQIAPVPMTTKNMFVIQPLSCYYCQALTKLSKVISASLSSNRTETLSNSLYATLIASYMCLNLYRVIYANPTPSHASALKGALSALFKHSSIILHIFCLSTLLGILTPN